MPIDQTRLDRARAALAAHQLDALVCCLPENILLLSGYWPMNGFGALVFPQTGDPVLIAPAAEEELVHARAWVKDVRFFNWGEVDSGDPFAQIADLLRDVATERTLRGGRIGYEGSFEFIAPPFASAEPKVMAGHTIQLLRDSFSVDLIDATGLLHDLRLRKTPDEIGKLRIAHDIARFALDAFYAAVVPGATEVQVAAAIEAAVLTRGSGYQGVNVARAWASVMSGPRAAQAFKPHLLSTQRVIQPGEMALLELAVVADGWWADLTRTRVAGQASAQDQERWQIVVDAEQAAIAAIRPGIAANAVDEKARTHIAAHNLGQYFVHHTGHGLGLRYHEPEPFLHPGGTTQLEEGMVTSVEPGIYIDGWGGMRCEDNVLVTPTGVEVLSEYSRALTG